MIKHLMKSIREYKKDSQCHLDICSIFVRLKIYFPMTSYSK